MSADRSTRPTVVGVVRAPELTSIRSPGPTPRRLAVACEIAMPEYLSGVSRDCSSSEPPSAATRSSVPNRVTPLLRSPCETITPRWIAGALVLTPGTLSICRSRRGSKPAELRAATSSVARPVMLFESRSIEPVTLVFATCTANTKATPIAMPNRASSSCTGCERTRRQ